VLFKAKVSGFASKRSSAVYRRVETASRHKAFGLAKTEAGQTLKGLNTLLTAGSSR